MAPDYIDNTWGSKRPDVSQENRERVAKLANYLTWNRSDSDFFTDIGRGMKIVSVRRPSEQSDDSAFDWEGF